jgi:hypothetical protein
VQLSKLGIKNRSNDITLSVQMVRMTIHGAITTNGPYVCEYAGDSLSSLGLPKYISPNMEALIDCPMTCGSIGQQKPGRYPAVIEVFGVNKDANGNESPEKMTALSEMVVL